MLDLESLKRFRDHKFKIFNMIPEWAKAYGVPEAAILRQIPFAHAWCNANPTKAPKKDPVRFLNNWLRIAQRMGSLVAHQSNRTYREKIPKNEDLPGPEEFAKFREAIKRG